MTVLTRVILCAPFLGLAGPPAGDQALAARALPISGLGRDVVIQAFVEPDAQNGSVFFVMDTSNLYSSSVVTLPGEGAPRTNMITFRMVPSGSYDVQVTLVGDEGERAFVTRPVELS